MQSLPNTPQNPDFGADLDTKNQNLPSKASYWALIGALLLGGALRLFPTLSSGQIIGDGGLFWNMVRAISDANFALPARVEYLTATPEIPFCYPPLGFYFAAIFWKLGVSPDLIFRFLPVFWSVLSIYFFARMARAILDDETAISLATILFPLFVFSFLWPIQGGGITRAPALCFAFGAIESSLKLWKRNENRALCPCAIFLALVLLTHLERAHFAVLTLVLIWIGFGKTRKSALQLAAIFAISLVLSAPWWATCVFRFGFAPFQAALSAGATPQNWALDFWSGEPVFPLIHLFAFAGIVLCLKRRQPFLPLWVLAIVIFEARSLRSFSIVPVALLAALAIQFLGAKISVRQPKIGLVLPAICVSWLLLGAIFTVFNAPKLSSNERAAMNWARQNTPLNARFLVIPQNEWASDLRGEWFPTFARRASVATVQGSEWLPRGEFARRVLGHRVLKNQKLLSEIETWALKTGARFDWIFCDAQSQLSRDLKASPNWKLAFGKRETAIFGRISKE